MCVCVYIYDASGQAAQGHVWHRSDWEATDGRVRSTSGLSCKLNAFSKPRLRKMLSSASEYCRNSIAPPSSSFEGKSLKREKDVTGGERIEMKQQKHQVPSKPSCSDSTLLLLTSSSDSPVVFRLRAEAFSLSSTTRCIR